MHRDSNPVIQASSPAPSRSPTPTLVPTPEDRQRSATPPTSSTRDLNKSSSCIMFPNQHQHQQYQQHPQQRYQQQQQQQQSTPYSQIDHVLDPTMAAMYQQQQAQASASSHLGTYPHSQGSSSPNSDSGDHSSYYQHPSPQMSSRKRGSPETMMPMDAPTQPRRYQTPSSTSRKEVPAFFSKRRTGPYHMSMNVSDGEEDELTEEPPAANATDQEKIEYKRRQNTLAARRSRKRKMMHQQYLEDQVAVLAREKDVWKTRAQTLRQLLVSHGIPCPDWVD